MIMCDISLEEERVWLRDFLALFTLPACDAEQRWAALTPPRPEPESDNLCSLWPRRHRMWLGRGC